MPDNNNILGSSVQIRGVDAAMDALAARQAQMDTFGPGMTGTAYTPANTAVDFQYAVLPGSSLITSQGLDARPNPAYDQSLQGRDRERASSLAQIQSIAAGLTPERLGANALASEGAPIIGPDFQVESGNGRSLAILTAYNQGLPSASAYQDYLTQNAGQFGIDPAQIAATENPVLVRIRQTEMDASARARFASEANYSSVAQMSDVERAQRDGQALLGSSILSQFVPTEGAGINPNINRDFLRGFADLLPSTEMGGFVQGDGQVSQAGLKQAQNALLAAAYPGADLSRMLESTDDNARNIGAAMLNASGRFAQIRAGADAGNLYDLGIGADVGEASGILSSLRDKGQTVKSYLTQASQADLFGDRPIDSLSPLVPDLLSAMDANKRSPKKLAEIFNAYAGGVEAVGNPQQGALFGGAVPTPQELFRAARGSVEKNDGEANALTFEFGEITEAATPAPRSRALPAGDAGREAEVRGAAPALSSSAAGAAQSIASDFAPSATPPVLPPGPPPAPPLLGDGGEGEEEEPKPETFLPRIGRPARVGFRRSAEMTRDQAEADVLRGYDAGTLNTLTMQKGQPGFSAKASKEAQGRFDSDVTARMETARQEQAAAVLGDDAGLAVPQGDGETWTGRNFERTSRALVPGSDLSRPVDGSYSRSFGLSENAETGLSVIGPNELVPNGPRGLARAFRPFEPTAMTRYGQVEPYSRSFSPADDPSIIEGEFSGTDMVPVGGADEVEGEIGGSGGGPGWASRLRSRMRNNLSDPRTRHSMAFGIGFSLMALGQGAARYAADQGDGTYHTPEQQAAAGAEALGPGVGGLIGTVVGGALGGPGGALVAQFAGAGIGQGASAVFGAAEERAQAARELNEALQAATGSVRDFSGAIANGSGAIKDVKAAVGQIGTVGTFGDNTFAGTDGLTAAFGENAAANWSAITRYASNPLTPKLARQISEGKAGYQEITSLGYEAAENGDFGALKQLQIAASESRLASNPQFQADEKEIEHGGPSLLGLRGLIVSSNRWLVAHGAGGLMGDDDLSNAIRDEAKLRKDNAGTPDPNAAAQNALVNDAADAKASSLSAQARMARVQAEGGGPADIDAAALAGRQADELAIQGLVRDRDNPINAASRPEIQAIIDGKRAEQSGWSAASMEGHIDTESAESSLAITRARLEGRSAREIGGEMRAQADYLRNLDGPISPAKRAGLDESALSMDYAARMGEYDEDLAGNDLHRAQAGARVARASVGSGGPQAVFDAQQGVLGTFNDRIKELSAELERGGLAVSDRISKEKELVGVQAEAATLAHDAQQALFTGRRGIAQDSLGALTDGLSRAVAIGGNAAITPQMVGEAGHSIQIDRDALAKARTPADRARWKRQLVDDQLAHDELVTEQNTYRPDAETLTADAAVGGTLTRAERLGGQARQDAARAALDRDQDKLAALGKVDAATNDPLAHLVNARTREALLTDAAEKKTEAQTWTMDVSERASDITATGAFRRAQLTPYADGTPGSDPLTAGNALITEKQKLLSEAQAALAKTDKTDPAFVSNTAAVEGLKTDIAELKHSQQTALLEAVPEILAGQASPGIQAGIVPPAALSARYAPGPLVGSWSRMAGNGMDGDHAQEDPFARAAHNATKGQTATTPALSVHGGAQSDDVQTRLLAEISRWLQQIATRGTMGGGLADRPAHDMVGPIQHALSQGIGH